MGSNITALTKILPSVINTIINPSDASKTPASSDHLFDKLMIQSKPARFLDKDYKESQLPPFKFSWPKGTEEFKEEIAYKPLVDYFKKIGLYATEVGHGERCSMGQLYDVPMYTIRQKNPWVHGQEVYFIQHIRGKTGVAVLEADPGESKVARFMVDFAVEVKTVSAMAASKTGCMREVMLQLLGLNQHNLRKSPPVILTNLAKTHVVFFLDMQTDDPPKFAILQQPCSSFASAVHFVRNVVLPRAPCSEHFARPKTPNED